MIFQRVIFTSLIIGCISGSGAQKPLKMTVYYESWNEESTKFIVSQLLKVWKEFKAYLQLHLVPIAIVQQTYRNGHMVFKCRGGPKECEENALHVCAHHLVCRGMEQINCPTELMNEALEYTKCMMTSNDQKEASKGCARRFKMPSTEISECACGWIGETLQSFYANVTFEEVPISKMELPHIVIDTYVEYSQEYARTHLRSLICGLLPDKCWESEEDYDDYDMPTWV